MSRPRFARTARPLRHATDAQRGLRRGYTLLEMVATSTLLAVVLVPSMKLMRDSWELSRRAETRSLVSTLCVSTLEKHLAQGAATFTDLHTTGTFTSQGHPQLRYQVTRSQSLGSGGIENHLMAVTATVWEDSNGNAAVDSNEIAVTFASKIANLPLYRSEAGNG